MPEQMRFAQLYKQLLSNLEPEPERAKKTLAAVLCRLSADCPPKNPRNPVDESEKL